MTSKELLYVEDALGHEKQMMNNLSGFSAQMQDPSLKSFLDELSGKHRKNFTALYNLFG